MISSFFRICIKTTNSMFISCAAVTRIPFKWMLETNREVLKNLFVICIAYFMAFFSILFWRLSCVLLSLYTQMTSSKQLWLLLYIFDFRHFQMKGKIHQIPHHRHIQCGRKSASKGEKTSNISRLLICVPQMLCGNEAISDIGIWDSESILGIARPCTLMNWIILNLLLSTAINFICYFKSLVGWRICYEQKVMCLLIVLMNGKLCSIYFGRLYTLRFIIIKLFLWWKKVSSTRVFFSNSVFLFFFLFMRTQTKYSANKLLIHKTTKRAAMQNEAIT